MPATPGKAKTAAKPKVKAASLHTLYPGPATRIASFDAVPVTVVHGNCLDALVGFIDGADVVVGCVAWVRNPVVLQHLAARPAMLVIQKESHWKGAEGSKPANRKVTSAYTLALHTGSQISPAHIPGRLLGDSQSELPRFACAGFGPATKFRPLLHDKFLVACAWRDTPTGRVLDPYAAWTGSFNFSTVAAGSLENAVILGAHEPAQAYLEEWARIVTIAEPLAWAHTAPQPGALLARLPRTSTGLVA